MKSGDTMEPTKSFKDLLAWQKAHQFVLSVYALTKSFPDHELYGVTSQLRRAAVSIAANIAEGYRKNRKADKLRYFNIAQGSLEECRYYLLLAEDLKYASPGFLDGRLEEVIKLLNGYANANRGIR
jgi:four helix bundle protein